VLASVHEHTEFVDDSFRNVQPMKLGMQKPRQATINFRVSLTTRAAAFNTRCNLSVIVFGAPAKTALQQSTRDDTKAWTSVAADTESSERRTRRS